MTKSMLLTYIPAMDKKVNKIDPLRESELNRWIANPAAYRPLVDVAE